MSACNPTIRKGQPLVRTPVTGGIFFDWGKLQKSGNLEIF